MRAAASPRCRRDACLLPNRARCAGRPGGPCPDRTRLSRSACCAATARRSRCAPSPRTGAPRRRASRSARRIARCSVSVRRQRALLGQAAPDPGPGGRPGQAVEQRAEHRVAASTATIRRWNSRSLATSSSTVGAVAERVQLRAQAVELLVGDALRPPSRWRPAPGCAGPPGTPAPCRRGGSPRRSSAPPAAAAAPGW